jgi:hypothetical protein
MTIFWSAALGFELASFRYGHGDAAQLLVSIAFLSVSVVYLVPQRALRFLIFAVSLPLLIIALFMLALHSSHTR